MAQMPERGIGKRFLAGEIGTEQTITYVNDQSQHLMTELSHYLQDSDFQLESLRHRMQS
jgi:hypothetical protein